MKSIKLIIHNTATKISCFLLTLVLLASSSVPVQAQGVDCYKEAVRNGFQWTTACDTDDIVGVCSAVGLEELDGHRIPATRGGAGLEQHLLVQGPDGDDGDINKHYQITRPFSEQYIDYSDPAVESYIQNGFARTNGGTGSPGTGSIGTNDPAEETWYMNMRWRYALWAWDGNAKLEGAPEQFDDFYQNKPKVIVSNPRTGKSVVATVIESGPAPWAGTPESNPNNPPEYWTGYVDGTPAGYDGAVSGLTPEIHKYLEVNQWIHGEGDELLYGWAPDQNAKPGPIESGSVPSGSCGNAVAGGFIGQPTFTGPEIRPTGIVLHWTGGDPLMPVDQFIAGIQSNPTCTGGCSSNFYIDGAGNIYQLTEPINPKTSHASGYNDCCIGIEIGAGGGTSDSEAIENARNQLISNSTQQEAVIQTVLYLMQQYNIPLVSDQTTKSGIFSHHQVNEGKSDVGDEYFDFIFQRLQQRAGDDN